MDFTRIERLRSGFGRMGIDGFYIQDPVNLYYLTGFHCSESALVVGLSEAVFVTDFRHMEDATGAMPGVRIAEVEQGAGCVSEAVKRADAMGVESLGFEGANLPHFTAALLSNLRGSGRAKPVEGAVERLRAVKDPSEIVLIRAALLAAERAFLALSQEIKPGVTEKRIQNRLESLIRDCGGDKGSFDHAVLFGARSSLPHGVPGGKKLEKGEPVLVDWGALVGGYHSDSTRMIYPTGQPEAYRRIHEIVRAAQSAAIATVRPGARACDVDAAARNHIASEGFEKEFGHGLGHGVGLMIHEPPRISRLSSETLVPGMVFTIEPGIYVPGTGGVRIEDMVLVTDEGCEVLGSLPTDARR